MKNLYSIEVLAYEDGDCKVYVPSVNLECMAPTIVDAMRMSREMLTQVIIDRIQKGEELPPDASMTGDTLIYKESLPLLIDVDTDNIGITDNLLETVASNKDVTVDKMKQVLSAFVTNETCNKEASAVILNCIKELEEEMVDKKEE